MTKMVKETKPIEDQEIVNIELSDLMTEGNGLSFEVLSEESVPDEEPKKEK